MFMFDTLTDSLNGVFKKLRARGKLHPKQVDNALGDIRTALLEADVAVEVADDLVARVRARALGEEVMKSLTPAQQVVKVVDEELTATMGGQHRPFELPSQRPAVIMMAGVQGSGKTTATAKLAKLLKSKGRRPLLVGADLERPAAVEQLRTLGREIGIPVVSDGRDPVKVAKNALKEAERQQADVVIVDTAGRLHVDADMMKQARKIRDAVKPHIVLMACDAMTGQDAVVQARAFMKDVDLTGFILTKVDGDSRGGAALSITFETGLPVYFVGTGEQPDDLEAFYPDRMASRILGMGDVLTLIDKASERMDSEAARESAERMMRAQFTFEDFLTQLREMKKLGPIQDLLKMLPSVPGGKNAIKDLAGEIDDGELQRAEAMICSMTREERQNPAIISGSRRLRIATGSGVATSDVNALIKDFEGARKMMRTMMGGKRMPGVMKMPKGSGR
jgi:signal recognition particle subunit SRP54